MIHVTMIIEDISIIATQRHDESQLLDVIVTDLHTSKQRKGEWTFTQFSAVAALTMGMGEDGSLSTESVQKLYVICNPLFKDWDKDIIPTP